MDIPDKIRIGTRGSLLALAQTDLLIQRLQNAYPQTVCEKVIIKTTGDRILDRPLPAFGGKGVFVTEFEEAIRCGEIDCAVHSAKDMPMDLQPGLELVCVLKREDVRDVLVTRKGCPLPGRTGGGETSAAYGRCGTLCDGAFTIGTGSLRRQAQLAQLYPDVQCKNLRGNVPTRLEKLKQGEFDGIVLAAAGLKRLGLDKEEGFDYRYFSVCEMLPAGGQGVIAVEGRSGEEQEFLRHLTDERTQIALETERSVLKKLNAGCHEAVGVYADVKEAKKKKELVVTVQLMKELAGRIIRKEGCAVLTEREAMAEQLALAMQEDCCTQ